MNTQKMIGQPIANWQSILENKGLPNLQAVESELSAIIQRATLLEAYISHRYNTGCGDQGHDKSAKVANRTVVRVRKALGFTYPERTGIRI